MTRQITGPRILIAVLVLVYATFWAWYGGSGTPMTSTEISSFFNQIIANTQRKGNEPDPHIVAELRELVKSDDGNQFYMVNLIRYRQQSQYPPGSPHASNTPAEANAAYGRALMPYLFRHGGHPVSISKWQGKFIQPDDADVWDDVAIIRYRSRRDMLNMIVEFTAPDLDVAVHKWASIEKTQVFPTQPVFSLASARLLIAVVLLIVGLLLHFLILRWLPFYNPKAN